MFQVQLTVKKQTDKQQLKESLAYIIHALSPKATTATLLHPPS